MKPDRIHYLTNRIEHLIEQGNNLPMGSEEHTKAQSQLREYAMEYFNLTGSYYRRPVRSSADIIRRRRLGV